MLSVQFWQRVFAMRTQFNVIGIQTLPTFNLTLRTTRLLGGTHHILSQFFFRKRRSQCLLQNHRLVTLRTIMQVIEDPSLIRFCFEVYYFPWCQVRRRLQQKPPRPYTFHYKLSRFYPYPYPE